MSDIEEQAEYLAIDAIHSALVATHGISKAASMIARLQVTSLLSTFPHLPEDKFEEVTGKLLDSLKLDAMESYRRVQARRNREAN